ncbi:hypothetical protein PVK06_047391 [Gossypium arboreum]|uniref:DUF4283 domain-containing protein n=1 Tax=Gossypium arboreum TaxID=29729 RepID=A0ABR0MDH3_GOSAR|nr:hypothetical protein PVK06_047391 [Gossypium arboreum]
MHANFSSFNSGVSRATKKVRTRSDLSLESKDLTMDGNGKKIQGSELPKATYKFTLMGALSNPSQNMFVEEDFPFIDGNITEVIEGVPLITFSDRVQKYIEHKMAKTIIVKLLGKKISFNALLNKVSHLWNLKSPIQLMDLENDFFLVRFYDEDDYNKVLVGGKWVIFGYARRGRFARLMICVNLRKPLVSKVRINEQLQHMEYESLLDVCFRYPNDTVDLKTTMKGLVRGLEQVSNGAYMKDDDLSGEEVIDADNDYSDKVVFGIAPLKMLEVDSFQAKFFQSQWDIVGPSECSLVKQTLGSAIRS